MQSLATIINNTFVTLIEKLMFLLFLIIFHTIRCLRATQVSVLQSKWKCWTSCLRWYQWKRSLLEVDIVRIRRTENHWPWLEKVQTVMFEEGSTHTDGSTPIKMEFLRGGDSMNRHSLVDLEYGRIESGLTLWNRHCLFQL